MSHDSPARTEVAGDLGRYRPALRRYFQKRAPAAEVEDLVQEVFVSLQARRSETAVADMQRYLFVVAGHVLGRRRRREAPWRGSGEGGLAELSEELSPERILLARERLGVAVQVIAALTPRTRQVFLLHRFEEMTYQTIAADLGISVSAVEKHIMIALRALTHGAELRP